MPTKQRKVILKKGPLPVIAIVGRPNVGKSTLFNRLIGKRKSIVQKESGTTRDLIQEPVIWQGKKFILMDTGGLEFAPSDTLQAAVESQVEQALDQADLLLWTVDASAGLVPLDERLAEKLRHANKRIFLVVNKSDDAARSEKETDFYKLGFKDSFRVSAMHGNGTGDLLDGITEVLPATAEADMQDPSYLFTIAIAGEPNSGKSTYLNQILGENRSLVAPIPGTTRDSVECLLERNGERWRVIDTAGFRTRNKVQEASTFFSLARTRDAIHDSDIVLLLFDAERGFTKTSKAIADFIQEAGKGVVLVANKWDKVKMPKADYARDLRKSITFLSLWPIEFMSALQGAFTEAPINRARALWNAYTRRVQTRDLVLALKQFVARKPPPPATRVNFILQTTIKPPSFTFFARHIGHIPSHYALYLENELSRKFHFEGIPIRVRIKESSGQ